MISQWVQIGAVVTARREGWTLQQWQAGYPGGDAAPDHCDHHGEWTSGGITVKVCTNCLGDEGETACKARHDEAVAFWKGIMEPDPSPFAFVVELVRGLWRRVFRAGP